MGEIDGAPVFGTLVGANVGLDEGCAVVGNKVMGDRVGEFAGELVGDVLGDEVAGLEVGVHVAHIARHTPFSCFGPQSSGTKN